MAKVLVTVPNTGWVHKSAVFVLLCLQKDTRGHDIQIILPTHKPYENNQHHIIRDFLEGDYDYWLSFDSDNPPMNNPLELIEFDKDIIGCPTPVFYFDESNHKPGETPVYWNAYKSQDDGYTEFPIKEGLQKVDAIGSGCFLIARRVFEHPEMQKGAFTRKLYPDGRVEKGNDISFCERAKECFFEIWAHYDYPCRHFNEVELTELIRAFHNMYKGED